MSKLIKITKVFISYRLFFFLRDSTSYQYLYYFHFLTKYKNEKPFSAQYSCNHRPAQFECQSCKLNHEVSRLEKPFFSPHKAILDVFDMQDSSRTEWSSVVSLFLSIPNSRGLWPLYLSFNVIPPAPLHAHSTCWEGKWCDIDNYLALLELKLNLEWLI